MKTNSECPHCQCPLEARYKFCPGCGRTLRFAEQSIPSMQSMETDLTTAPPNKQSKEVPSASTLHRALIKYFGHDQFRSGQQEIIEAILQGRDILAVMPTGSGKSLCYQLPPVLSKSTVLVISPLISLMEDQVAQLTLRGIKAACLHSAKSEDERRQVISDWAAKKLRILYVAPERFAGDFFIDCDDSGIIGHHNDVSF